MQPSRLSKRTAIRLKDTARLAQRPRLAPIHPPTPASSAPAPILPAAPARAYKLAQRSARMERTVVRVGQALIGGGHPVLIGGPCSVENEEQVLATAEAVRAAGGEILRGGAFKPQMPPAVRDALAQSYHETYVLLTIVVLPTFAIAWFLRQPAWRTKTATGAPPVGEAEPREMALAAGE